MNIAQANRSLLSITALAVTVLLFLLFWLLWPQEFIASDPWVYSKRAYLVSQTLDFGNGGVFDHRLSIVLPTASFYQLFGVSTHTTNLVSLLSCILIIFTVWLALPNIRSKIIGLILCLLSVPLFNASVALYPDIVASSFMAFSFQLLLLRQKVVREYAGKYLGWLSFLSVFSLFVAFLAKLSFYWVLPLWIWAFIVDLKSNETAILVRRFYLPAIFVGLVLSAGYFLFCDQIWGDPLSRLHVVQSLTGKHLWAWGDSSAIELAKRLTIDPVKMLIEQYGITILALSFISQFIASSSIKPWIYYTLSCLLLFWFGSTSLTSYEPLPLVDRMTLPMLPALIILAAYSASKLDVLPPSRPWVRLYLPSIFLILLLLVPFGKNIDGLWEAEPAKKRAMQIVMESVKQNPSKTVYVICAESRSPTFLAFYFGYQYPDNLKIVYFGDLADDYQLPQNAFIYLDRKRASFLSRAYGMINYKNELEALSHDILFDDGSISLLKLH